MSEIAGVTIDWTDYSAPTSPRLINIPDSAGDITVQDLIDTLSALQAEVDHLVYDALMVNADTAGKQQLGTGKFVGLTLTLNNAQVRFPDQPGPAYVIKRVTDGNIVAVDHAGDPILPLASSAFTNWFVESDVSAAIVETTPGFTQADRDNIGNIQTIMGLKIGEPVVTSKSLISFGSVLIQISTASDGSVTLERVS